jgi:hypothetical protein
MPLAAAIFKFWLACSLYIKHKLVKNMNMSMKFTCDRLKWKKMATAKGVETP